jgi:hypothetical protein
MKRTLALALSLGVLLTSWPAFADSPDPGYLKAFGYGSIAASAAGYPEFGKYDPAQFEYKDGKFIIPADGTLDLRAFLPKGMTIGKALTKAKKERGANLKYRQADFMSFRVWPSHDSAGQDKTNGKWPTKLADVPIWAPLTDARFEINGDSPSWPSAGARWEDNLKADMTSLRAAKIGHKYYVVFSVGYRYKTPGGAIENKWDDVLHRFVPTKSTGMVGFVYGSPLAACTIEIGAGPDQSSHFKASGDGVTDSRTGLTWAKNASVELRYIDVPSRHEKGAVTHVKGLPGGWRLPTREELVFFRKAGGEKPFEWFNAHGFTGVKTGSYWTSTETPPARVWVVNFGTNREPGVMDTTDQGYVWPVKGK